MHNELANHRVVVRWDAVTRPCMRIESHTKPTWRHKRFDEPRLRHEAAIRIFSINATFNRMTVGVNVGLLHAQRLARSNHDLLAHDVDARDHFGHRMLDLHTRVHFQHVEVLLRVHEKLNGRGTRILRACNQRCRTFADKFALDRINARRRSFFDQFLMTALA